MNRPKQIGTRAETAVVRYLRKNGWPAAERRALTGAHDRGDITGCPGLVFEVKGGEAARKATDRLVHGWLAETDNERRNSGADFGVLVLQRRGIGPDRAGRWWAVIPVADFAVLTAAMVHPTTYHLPEAPVRLLLADLVSLLRAAGYGTPLPADQSTTGPRPVVAAAGR